MTEWRLFPEGTIPEFTTARWYAGRERAPHLEQDDHRPRLLLTAQAIRYLSGMRPVRSIVDLGCGDGGLLYLLKDAGFLAVWGYDVSLAAVEGAAERGVSAEQLDVISSEPQWADLAVVTEMLEHQVDPHGFLRRVRRHCDYVVASSPANESAELHYEYHAWAWDLAGYRAMFVNAGWRVLTQETVGSYQLITAEAA